MRYKKERSHSPLLHLDGPYLKMALCTSFHALSLNPSSHFRTNMLSWLRTLALLVCAAVPSIADSGLSVTVQPAAPLIEHGRAQQFLNFDFAIHNQSRHSLRLVAVDLSVYDDAGQLISQKTVNSNGLEPGIATVSPHLLKPGSVTDIFNPFPRFDPALKLSRLQYTFQFVVEDSVKEAVRNRKRLLMDVDVTQRVVVRPLDYVPRTELMLPLKGRLLVWEGHDYLAHHRRIPLDSRAVKDIGIEGANANRYAADLVVVDDNGNMFRGSAFEKAHYYTYGQPIYAPAGGTVAASRNDIPDNAFRGKQIVYPTVPKSSDDGLGNYVIIDHEDGEFSLLPHMRPGSVRVRAGEKVKAGQIIGNVGFSGDAIFPHVHYALMSCVSVNKCEGVPSYFKGVIRLLGNSKQQNENVILESGDLITAAGDSK